MLSTIVSIGFVCFALYAFEYYIGYIFYIIGGILAQFSLPISVINNYIYPVGSIVYNFYYVFIICLFTFFVIKLVLKIKSHD